MAGPIGVILGQLGTPDAPTPAAVRRYLTEFLGDPRVLEMNRLSRWLLLHLAVLPRRAAPVAALYRGIWSADGPPLLVHTRAQAAALETALGDGVRVAVGMRYGRPSLDTAVEDLRAAGSEKVLLVPLFPQYSGATTGSLVERFFRALLGRRRLPAVRVAPPFHAHPAYVGAVVAAAREALGGPAGPPDKVVFSFHGIPKRYVDRGDPYPFQVEESARRIAAALGLPEASWALAYQSRFGRDEWLGPPTFEALEGLARGGARRVAVLCPGFVADCLETIDEIGRRARDRFLAAGGAELTLVPGLNSRPEWIDGLARIVREELAGWVG